MRTSFVITATLCVWLGCDDPPGDPPPIEPPQTDEATDMVPAAPTTEALPEATPTQLGMHDRYRVVEDMLYALIDGDADDARRIADELGPVDPNGMPEAALPFRAVIAERARAFHATETQLEATRAFAELVRGCGECHAAAEVDWFVPPTAVPEGDALPAHMRRHEWAMVRMHEGLVVGNAERFDLGARALEEAPIVGEVPPDDEHPPGLSALESDMHARAHDARVAEDLHERAAIYGDLLEHCASCHRAIDELDRGD